MSASRVYMFQMLLQEKQIHILSSNVVKIKSACVSNVSPTSTISELFFESPSQIVHFRARVWKKGLLFVGHAFRPGHHASHLSQSLLWICQQPV